MGNNVVTISGMFGNGKTYFADSPVVIDISGLAWPATSPFCIVNVEVVYNIPPLTQEGATENKTVGKFEEEFAATWGIGVQVANADDTKLADNAATLVAAGK